MGQAQAGDLLHLEHPSRPQENHCQDGAGLSQLVGGGVGRLD